MSEVDRLRRRVAELEAQVGRAGGPDLEPAEGGPPPVGLSEREALLSGAEKIAQMGSWIWDIPSNRVSWSDGLFRILGYDPRTVTATTESFFGAVHPDDRRQVREASQRNVETGATPPIHFRIQRPNGEVRDVVMEGAMTREAGGRLVRVVGTVLDITEKTRRDADLRRSEHLLKEAQRIAGVGSFRWEIATRKIDWSDELRRICGVADDEEATVARFLAFAHAEDRDRVAAAWEGAVATGELEPIEFRVTRADGLRFVLMSAQPVRDGSAGLTGFIGTLTDLTARRSMENRLLQSQKMEAIGRLAGGVAHDFNNLLTVIIAHVGILRARSSDEGLDAIAHASMAAADLTRQLLAFSRQAVLRPKVIDLNEVTSNALKLIRRLIGEDIALSFERAPDLWKIEADPTEIERILLNLAANARDAMSKGGTLALKTMNTVRHEGIARSGAEGPSGNYVLLSVTDTGDGMDEATRSLIFEPFFTTKDLGKGTGLGLATVFGIIAQSGGKIEVTSTPGEGSRFAMYFPAALREPQAEDVAARSPRAAGGRETILLVEDERAVRDVVARILRNAGYGVLVASGPAEARQLHAASKVKVALLLTDLVMPEMSGQDLAEALLRVDEGLRVLYLTGYAPRRFLRGAGSTHGPFLEKPFTAETLLLRVRAALEDTED